MICVYIYYTWLAQSQASFSARYTEPFRPDSMPLVEHLFHDLVLTTESYKEARDRLEVIDQKYQEVHCTVSLWFVKHFHLLTIK